MFYSRDQFQPKHMVYVCSEDSPRRDNPKPLWLQGSHGGHDKVRHPRSCFRRAFGSGAAGRTISKANASGRLGFISLLAKCRREQVGACRRVCFDQVKERPWRRSMRIAVLRSTRSSASSPFNKFFQSVQLFIWLSYKTCHASIDICQPFMDLGFSRS